ncbi:MAG: type I-D CRISPR-associated protein Cas5/Csc1 [Bacteroidales bacterium]|jgi:CRISPR type I-D-associated protein Csc1|nr:type I-D CRISPR-associated protein Cas5/Csc1 [Bacteroidales bacterium]
MQTKIIKLTLLNHLFYYTEVSGGSTSASVTGSFIGDLALTYAFNRCLNENQTMYNFRLKPEYTEIKDFGFYCTVAKPAKANVGKTENYIRNTLFNVDGFIDIDRIDKSGKSPFKNFRQVQGVKLGTEFIALFISKENIELPSTIRVGTGKETLVKVEEIDSGVKDSDYWLNAFTLKEVFNNLDIAIKVMMDEKKANFTYILENYNIIKHFSLENIKEVFNPIF